jgi:hypothetical protein
VAKGYRAKLPPGAAADLRRELNACRKSAKLGVLAGVQILASPGCPVSEAQAGQIYPIDHVPSLPLPGCEREPCCACCYQGVAKR